MATLAGTLFRILTPVFIFKEGCEVNAIEEVDTVDVAVEDVKLASYPYVHLERIKVRVPSVNWLGSSLVVFEFIVLNITPFVF
jgi:hypothetical protein